MKSSLFVLCLVCGFLAGCGSIEHANPKSEIEASAKCALMGAKLREFRTDVVKIFGVKLWESHHYSCELDKALAERKILQQFLYPD